MTSTPATMRTPHINHEALEAEIRKHLVIAEDTEIVTRAQARLKDAMETADLLEFERGETRNEIAKCKANIVRLQNLLSQLDANEADINIDLSSVLATIDALRVAGVTLPPKPVEREAS